MIKFQNISYFQIFPDDDRLEMSIKKIRCPFDLKLWRVEPYNWNLVSVHSYMEYLRFFDFVLRGELFSTPMGLKLRFVSYLSAGIHRPISSNWSQTFNFFPGPTRALKFWEFSKILTLIVKHYFGASVLFRMIQKALDNFHSDSFYSEKLSDLIGWSA